MKKKNLWCFVQPFLCITSNEFIQPKKVIYFINSQLFDSVGLGVARFDYLIGLSIDGAVSFLLGFADSIIGRNFKREAFTSSIFLCLL